MGSRSEIGDGIEQIQARAFGGSFIPNMYHDPHSYPRNVTKILKAICDCLGLGKPTYNLEKGPLSSDSELQKIHQVTCDIDSLMCSAIAGSTEEAIRGSAFRMSARLMSCITFGELEALKTLCGQQGLSLNDVTLLKQLLSLANPTCHDNNASIASHRPEASSLPPQQTQFDHRDAGSALFSLLGCASASPDGNVSNPLLRILKPLQLHHIKEAPKTFHGLLSTSNSGSITASGEFVFAKPPEVTETTTGIAAAICQALGAGCKSNGKDTERTRNSSCSSSSSKSGQTVDSISRVKHYCDRRGLEYFYDCAQTQDTPSPYFKADLTIDRSTHQQESLQSYGYGRTKKSAKHNAAFNMLQNIETN